MPIDRKLDEDIPGTRQSIEEVATPFHVYFLLLMTVISSALFLAGVGTLGRTELGKAPDSLVMLGVGIMGFSLFFPWFVAMYYGRHLLIAVKRVERRLDAIEAKGKSGPNREDDEF